MSLPDKKIKKVQLPNADEYEIIPDRLQGTDDKYSFSVGQSLKSNSTRIYFDRNYENNLISLLQGLTYSSSNPLNIPICNLMTITNPNYGSASYYLLAVDLTSQNLGYCLATFDDYSVSSTYHLTVRYGTVAGSGYGMTWTQGYNNLDGSDGFYFIGEDLATCTVASLSSGSSWNGSIIYSDEGTSSGSGNKYEAKLPPLSHDSVIALQSDIKNSTITLTQGGVTKGSFTLNQSSNSTIDLDAGGGSIDYDELIHKPIENVLSGTTYEDGRYYKKADESGVLLPFNSDDYVSYIYCDTSKSSELSSLLATFNYSQASGTLSACYMVEGRGDWGMYALKDTSSGTNYIVALLTDNLHPIYATGSGSIDIGLGAVSYISGWQNLDSDDKYSIGGSLQIRGAYQDGWNGIILGKGIGSIYGAISRYIGSSLYDVLTQKDLESMVIDGGTFSLSELLSDGYTSYTMSSSVLDAICNTNKSCILRLAGSYSSIGTYYLYFRASFVGIGTNNTKGVDLSCVGSNMSFYFNDVFDSTNLTRTLYKGNNGVEDLDSFLKTQDLGTLTTTSTTSETPTSQESFGGTIYLHKISKTGSYNDLLDKPDLSSLHTHSNKQALDNFEVTTTSVTDGTTTFNQYVHPTAIAVTAGLYEVGCDSLGHTIIGNSFTIPDTSNMVTTNTTQTISGTKTFSGTTVFSNGISVTHDVKTDYLEVSSAGHETGTYGKIATLSSTGYIRYRTPAEIASDIGCIPLTGSSAITGSLTPNAASNSQTLGTSSKMWNAIYGTNFYSSSDRRLKENIEDVELECRDLIKNIEIKEFNFKDDKDKKVVVGAIAQQLKEVLPEKYQKELISGDEDSYYSINESKLVYVVMKALQDEMYKNEVLEDRVEELEKEIGEIKYAILH